MGKLLYFSDFGISTYKDHDKQKDEVLSYEKTGIRFKKSYDTEPTVYFNDKEAE